MRARLAVWLALILGLVALGQADAVRLNTGTGRALIAPQSSSGQFGVNLSGLEFAPWNGQTAPTAANWDDLQAKRVKFVRLPIAMESMQPALLGALDATYLATTRAAIAAGYARGIGVMPNLHNFAHYCAQAQWLTTCGYAGNVGSSGTGVSVLGDATFTQAAFVDVWSRLATALVGTPGLAGYGLMNEVTGMAVTNLLTAPNYLGGAPWGSFNAGSIAQLGVGSNPIAGYSPAWRIVSTNFFGIAHGFTFANVQYTMSCWAKALTGTVGIVFQIGDQNSSEKTATTSWTRLSASATPSAGASSANLLVNAAGVTVDVADCMLQTGGSVTAYEPSPFQAPAQAAITAIRAVDATTPIYVDGIDFSPAATWPQVNQDLIALTGGNIIFDAHMYPDVSSPPAAGSGAFSGTFTSYGITTAAGITNVAPFVGWLQANSGARGFIGEFNVPNSVADADPQWLILQNNFTRYLKQNAVPATIWFYNSGLLQPANPLGIAPKTGVDDPRLLNLLRFNYLLKRDLGAANDDRPAFLAAAA